MAYITLSGQLYQAMNESAAEGNKILFVPQQTVGKVLPGAASELVVESDGTYSITLAYNTYSIYHYSDVTRRKTLIASNIVVSADTLVSTITDLIGSTVPITDDGVLTIQGYLTEAQDSAEAAANSETNAAASEAAVTNRVAAYEVETTEYLINTFDGSALETGDVVRTLGYYTAGDGGGAEWVKTGETGTGSQDPSETISGKVNASDGDVFELTMDSTDLPAKCLGLFPETGNDVILYFNACLTFINANNKNLQLDAGEYLVSSTIQFLDSPGSFIKGRGEDLTIIAPYDTFAGALLRHGSSQSRSLGKINGGGVADLSVDCGDQCSYGLVSISTNHSVYRNIRALDGTAVSFMMTCQDASIGDIDAPDSQHCEIVNIFTRNLTQGIGVYVDGNAGTEATLGGNASLNYFENIFCQIGGTANGFVFGFADGNTLNFLRVNQLTSGTGYGLVFSADDDGVKRHARQNICYSVQTAVSGVLAEAGDGTEPSYQNAIYGFNTGNAGIDNSPTVETGASLQWIDQTQAVFMGINKGLSVSTVSYLTSSADIVSIQDNDTPEAAHTLFSRTGAHLDFISSTDGSGDKWRMGFSEGGEFAVTRPRSSDGSMVINAPLELRGQVLSDGDLVVTINYVDYKISLTAV